MKNKLWSRKYNCCQNCGIIEIPHKGNGLCIKCYDKKFQHGYYLINKENYKIKNKRYRLSHEAYFIMKRKEYHYPNHKKYNEKRKLKYQQDKSYYIKYYEANKLEISRKRKLKYYQNNELEKTKEYYRTDNGRETSKMNSRKRRARKRNLNFWTKEMTQRWWWMLDATEGYCPNCGNYFGIDKLQMDHIIPLSKNGIHHINNVQALCQHCNCSKNNILYRKEDYFALSIKI